VAGSPAKLRRSMPRVPSLALALVAAACTPGPAQEAPGLLGSLPVERPTSTPAPATSASSTAAAPDAAASPADDPADRPRPERTGIGGSTRGTVACGSKRCAAPAEGCAWSDAAHDWRCQAPDAPIDDDSDVGPTFVACDDGTDCAQGQTCCNLWGQHFSASTACVARADVNATCASEICIEGGAQCPAGRTCQGATATVAGVCDAPSGPATCGGRRRCPASAPICAMLPAGPTCVARDSAPWRSVPGRLRFECTLQSDCHAGDTCAYEFGEIEHDRGTYCGKWHPAYQGSLVCEVGKLEPCAGDAECRARMTCHPAPDRPPWMGVWGSR
jgi:hypothetical protein